MSDVEAELVPRRAMRADARRNYDALLVAARDAFATGGVQASLEDIARRAGVGVGTLYRHFPTRQDLLRSVYLDEVTALVRFAEEQPGADAWDALVAWLRRFVEYVGTKRALAEGLRFDEPVMRSARDRMMAAGAPLLARAQEAGVARDELDIDDVVSLVLGIVMMNADDRERLERLLRVGLDGLRAPAGR
ncbi:regulatory protein TetR [Beutenbergia cavernae DSM 12333]|uniref:Regulatory protein TetR n=1 Tax=Beutenbergia cavernae (strain ATCC BAA-8 / DSM 12333 / CCUG 43141 / JCM 11478 / NBRC 16432 / NCIMB 13614 / HKI 0122) TaxID=471853 RepID=C5C5U7_BEUC1|nr:TetR/AcrR family transcriptional regulator [Beutenbergia cavernae]ACQ82305.1 regulatory protein TetR [Beutenbergia cavernae DSM 12333]